MKATGMIIAGFVLVVVGLGLLVAIAPIINDRVSKTSTVQTVNLAPARIAAGAINSSYVFTIDSSTYGQFAGTPGCSITDVITAGNLIAKNSTGATLDMNGCGSAGDYYFAEGVNSINFCNSANVNNSLSNTTTLTYSYCPDSYVSGWAGNVLQLTVGFLGLALLAAGLAVFYGVFKDVGII